MMDGTRSGSSPRFSLISVIQEDSPHLGEFLASIDAQRFPADQVEVVVVDAGCTEASGELARSWRRRRCGPVRMVSAGKDDKPAARNLGIAQAGASWITFTDPDRTLDPDYLAAVDAFLRKNPAVQLAVCNPVGTVDGTGQVLDHPLAQHFRRKDRLRNLDLEPEYFPGSAGTSFFRRSAVEDAGLQVDPRVAPHFAGGHFCGRYLLSRPEPVVGFLTSARSLPRGGDGGAAASARTLHAGHFTDVLRYGFLDVLHRGRESQGRLPVWLQNQVLYELWWYFFAADQTSEAPSVARGEVAAEFHDLLGQIVALLDGHVVEGFTVRPYKPAWRDVLLHGYDGRPWHSPSVIVDRLDRQQGVMRVTYRYSGRVPTEEFLVDGTPRRPPHHKSRGLLYFDRVTVHERLVWLPLGTLRVRLDGREIELRTAEDPPPRHVMSRPRIQRDVLPPPDTSASAAPLLSRGQVQDALIRRLAASRPVRRLFGSAWVLMDRVADADDSGEHLFRHLRKNHRQVNAWFVIDRESPGYRRLRAAGYRRVVPYGTLAWKLLMLNCENLISSHIDVPIARPPALASLMPVPTWRFTFLQHGVINSDISNWLNAKQIDLMVTSTPAEHASVCGDGSPYRLTTKETKLVGLPRFDQVLAEGKRFPPEQRDLVLVAPTWRKWLAAPGPSGPEPASAATATFRSSEFAENWRALLDSGRLHELTQAHGLTVGLLLHYDLQLYLAALDLPPAVQIFRFADTNVRTLFARARVVVTDYSSMAFNAAYIDRPVVYFQFDSERVRQGGHLGRAGYFDYERDGFGPVVFGADAAVEAVAGALRLGAAPAPEYRRRIEATFPARDGRCCERVVDAIRDANRRACPAPSKEGGR